MSTEASMRKISGRRLISWREHALRCRGIVVRCLVALLVCTISASSPRAQNGAPSIRVVTRAVPPLVVEQNGALSGFSIDLWNSIAERLKLETRYQTAADVDALRPCARRRPTSESRRSL